MANNNILLNLQQLEAVESNNGPLLIIAGAGTGKTTVIVEKIKYLIKNNLAKPDEILALTFTEKASYEMEERVDKEMPYGYFQMWISTFHSFADRILKEEIIHIGLSPTYKLLTQAEAIIFLKSNLFLFGLKYFRPLSNPNKFIEALLQHFSRLKDEDIKPEEYLKWAKAQKNNPQVNEEEKEKYLELAHAYLLYQNLKVKKGYFDFSDLIYYLIKLFSERKNILKKYQQQFHYVLIDEFQDTNIAQYNLIKMLCPSKTNPFLTLVGDDSQAIYKFRGASVSNILTFMEDYPQANKITLLRNYRSYQNILDISYQLIKHNDPDTLEAKLGISKKLISSREKTKIKEENIKYYLADKAEDEADFVTDEIIKFSQKYKYSDFAILIRANNHSDSFTRSLTRKGIPYQFLGPTLLYKQPEVKDLIAYLKVLYNLEDSPSLFRVLSMDIFNCDQKDIFLLLLFAKKINYPLSQAIEVYLSFFEQDLFKSEYEIYKKYLPLIKEETRKTLIFIYEMINRHLTLSKRETAGQILYYFLEDTKYLNKLTLFKTEKEEKIANNISKFFNKLKAFETEYEDASIFAVVDYLEMSMELGESPISADDISKENAVNIITVHSAKGLEFPVVFLVNLTKGRFPTSEKKEPIPIPKELIKEILPEGDYHLEEERRLFYVGLTRAKDYVYLTASSFYGEGKRERKISPFIMETLGEDKIKLFARIKKEEKTQLTIFDYKKPEEKVKETQLEEKDKIKPLTFSYSQLETFNTCPLQYKYQYILKIPSVAGAAASFGETIHKALQNYYQEFLNDNNSDLSVLLDIYKKSWIPIGYSSLAHQSRMKKEGEKLLSDYYHNFHSKNLKIVDLEKFFRIKIDNQIIISGKIDRVDYKDNGQIEIIDYKTGKKPDENKIKKSLQLSIYALAATDVGLYQKNLGQVNLTFYYLQEMEKFTMKRTPEEIENVKTEVKKTVELIWENNFNPKVGPWCKFCSFKIICEAWQ